MSDKGKSGETGPSSDGKSENHSSQEKKAAKPLRHVTDTRRQNTDANSTSSSSPHTRELGDTISKSEFSTDAWRQEQLKSMTDYWRKTGQLEEAKRRADALGVDPTSGVTKELSVEATQKLTENRDIQPIAEIPRGDNTTSSKPLSSEQIAKDRQIARPLYEDRRKQQPPFVRSRL